MKTASWFGFVLCALSAAGDVFIAQVGQRAVLDCGINDFKQSLLWRRGEEQKLRITIRSGFPTKEFSARSRNVKQTSLEISGVTEQDAGDFTCVADGSSHKHTLSVVSVSVDPHSPLERGGEAKVHCKVNNPCQEGSTVEWERPNHSKTPSDTVHLNPVEASHEGTWTCHHTCEGKSFKALLTIKVKEPVSSSTTPPKTSKNVKASLPRGHDGSHGAVLLGLSWWVWVAAGLGCVAVIVLIISVVITYKKVKRRKRRFAQQQQRIKKYCQCGSKTAAEKPQPGRRREKPSALPLQPLLKE